MCLLHQKYFSEASCFTTNLSFLCVLFWWQLISLSLTITTGHDNVGRCFLSGARLLLVWHWNWVVLSWCLVMRHDTVLSDSLVYCIISVQCQDSHHSDAGGWPGLERGLVAQPPLPHPAPPQPQHWGSVSAPVLRHSQVFSQQSCSHDRHGPLQENIIKHSSLIVRLLSLEDWSSERSNREVSAGRSEHQYQDTASVSSGGRLQHSYSG